MAQSKWIVLGTILGAVAAAPVSAVPCGASKQVVTGDNCWDLRTSAGLNEEVFKAINPSLDCNSLKIGQPVCLEPCQNYYLVATGGSCWSIMTNAGISHAKWDALNPALDCNTLRVGQPICVQNCLRQTKLQSGGSCWAITQDAKISQSDLDRLNPTLDCGKLQIGQQICTAACSKYEKVAGAMNSCWAIQDKYKLGSVDNLLKMNPGLNCNTLQAGERVCVKLGAPTSPLIWPPPAAPTPPKPTQPPPTCTKTYDVVSGDTCDLIADKSQLSRTLFQSMNPSVDCTKLSIGQKLCVGNRVSNCPQVYVAVEGDTCASLAANYGLSLDEFQKINTGLNCNAPLVGASLCMGSKPATCIQYMTVKPGDTCYALQMAAGITEEEWTALNGFGPGPNQVCGAGLQSLAAKMKKRLADFQQANTWLDCNRPLPEGQRYCISSRMTAGCQKMYTVKPGETCSSISSANGLTDDLLLLANNGLQCSVLREGQHICLEAPPPSCEVEITLMGPANSTISCDNAAAQYKLTPDAFRRLNPHITCQKPLPMMTNVCIRAAEATSSQNTQLLSETIKIAGIDDPEVAQLVEQYRNNPSDANYSLLGLRLLKTLGTAKGRETLIQLESADPYFKALAKSKAAQRAEYCKRFDKNSEPELSKCFCGSDPLLYCMSILQTRMNDVLKDTATVKLIRKAFTEAIKKNLTPERIQQASLQQGYDLNAIQRDIKEANGKNATALTARAPSIPGLKCEADGGISQLFGAFRALQKGGKAGLMDWAKDPGTGNPIPADACLLGQCCWPMWGNTATIGVQFGPCFGGGMCLADLDTKNAFGSECTEEGCTYAGNAFTDVSVRDLHISLFVKFCFEFNDQVNKLYSTPIIGHILEDMRCLLEISLKLFAFRGDLQYGAKLQLGPLVLEIQGNTQIYQSDLFCQDPCAHDYCRAKNGDTTGKLALKVDYFVGSSTVFTKTLGELEECSPKEEKAQQLNRKSPNPVKGRVVGSYFPNWVAYHDDRLLPRLLEQARHLTHIYVGFQTISYSIQYDSYYLDFSDPWGDLNMCRGLPDDECHAYNGPEVNFESPGCMTVDIPQCAPGVVAVAPYLGDPTPAPTKPEYQANGKPRVCGQFQYLLQQVKMSNPDVRVIISIGGWYDSPYWSVATSPKYIDRFVESIGRWTDVFDFDGVDVDWEFPGFEHGGQPVYPATSAPGNVEETTDCSKQQCNYPDRGQDGERYVNLLRKLRERLSRSGPLKTGLTMNKVPFEISIAPPVGFDKVEKMHLAEMCQNLDHINMMAYDLHGSWDELTNHQAHFHDHTPNAKGKQYELEGAIQAFLDGGCSPDKLVLGVPFYGRAYKNVDPGPDTSRPGLYQRHSGNAYNEQGILSFREISQNPAWKTFWDDDAKASAAYNARDRTFVSYDSVQAVQYKVERIKELGLKGAMYWLMGQDDEQNTLLRTLSEGLRR
ncbi:chitinase [Spizellomyces sp. 'palustris']|nr:chitinase [Spizellomyces sp. 'palustris']